mmetsp:Transcript_44560/g.107999  ORF Transcript_44560/g.107999 Transcript_44560/m.107999 type:complete len:201 (-) Transcript_44560:914-1516(-)
MIPPPITSPLGPDPVKLEPPIVPLPVPPKRPPLFDDKIWSPEFHLSLLPPIANLEAPVDCNGPSKTSPPKPPRPSTPEDDAASSDNGLGPPPDNTWIAPAEGPTGSPEDIPIGSPIETGGATGNGVAITSPPMDETPSELLVVVEYRGCVEAAVEAVAEFLLLDELPASEFEGDVDMAAADLAPFDFFDPVRMLGSFVIS